MPGRVREKVVLALVLASVAGFADAAGYLVLRQLFTAHMSGNSAALGAHLGRAEWHAAVRRAVPIPLFVVGVMTGSAVVEISNRRRMRAPFAMALLGEVLLLALFVLTARALIPGGTHRLDGWDLYLPTGLLAAAMGVQNATLRHVGESGVRTTYVSGTLTDMSEDAVASAFRLWDDARRGGLAGALRSLHRQPAPRRAVRAAALFASFIGGAVVGAYLETLSAFAAFGVPLAALALIVSRDFAHPLPIRRPGTA